MNNQILEINDQDLQSIQGGGGGALGAWIIYNVYTMGVPMFVDGLTGAHVSTAAVEAPF